MFSNSFAAMMIPPGSFDDDEVMEEKENEKEVGDVQFNNTTILPGQSDPVLLGENNSDHVSFDETSSVNSKKRFSAILKSIKRSVTPTRSRSPSVNSENSDKGSIKSNQSSNSFNPLRLFTSHRINNKTNDIDNSEDTQIDSLIQSPTVNPTITTTTGPMRSSSVKQSRQLSLSPSIPPIIPGGYATISSNTNEIPIANVNHIVSEPSIDLKLKINKIPKSSTKNRDSSKFFIPKTNP